jgi:hypothetical protein
MPPYQNITGPEALQRLLAQQRQTRTYEDQAAEQSANDAIARALAEQAPAGSLPGAGIPGGADPTAATGGAEDCEPRRRSRDDADGGPPSGALCGERVHGGPPVWEGTAPGTGTRRRGPLVPAAAARAG